MEPSLPAPVTTTARSSTIFEKQQPSDLSSQSTPAMSTAPSFQKEEEDGYRTDRTAQASSSDEEAARKPSSESRHSSSQSHSREITGFKWFLVCVAIYISAFLYGLDTTIAADIQGPVVQQFGRVDQLSWIGSGFPLGSVAVLLLMGNLYGHFNMKWIYAASVALFEIGSLICGAAPNMNALIVGRVLAGAGGSGIYLGALNYFTMLCSPEERGTYISLTGIWWGLGAVLGPIIGGAFAVSSATWRWAFYINLVVGAIAAPVFVFFLPSYHPSKGVSIRDRLVHIDFLGLFLIAATWVTFAMGFSFAGGAWPWNDGRTIAVIVVFIVLLITTIAQQYFAIATTTANRAFPGHLIKSRTQVLLFIATSASSAILFNVTYYIPIYFQFVHDDSAMQAAVRLMPFIIIMVVVNLAAGHLLSRVRMYMPIYVVSGVLALLGGSLLMVYLQPETSQATIYGLSVLIAFGVGLTIQLGYAVGTLSVSSPSDVGHAINMQNISQIGSSMLVLVIAGQIFHTTAVQNLTAALEGQGFTAAEIVEGVSGAQSKLFQMLTGEVRDRAILAIVSAMQKSFALAIVGGGMVLLAGLFMKRERLFGEVVTA